MSLANTIHHSAFIYNQLKKLNLCKFYSNRVINHLISILISIFISGYHGKTTDFAKNSSCHRTTIAHFLNSGKWDESLLSDTLKRSVIEIIYSEAARTGKPVFCIVDDTIASKTKPSSRALHPIEDAYFHQSHLKGKQDYGHQAVSVMLSCNGIVLNYAFVLYNKAISKIDIVQDIAKGYRKVIADLYAAGCRNIQFDDCSWGMIVDPNAKAIFGVDDAGLEDIKRLLLRINNLAIDGKPEDLVITTHVCRGNFHSTYASSGAYDSVAETLFAGENVSAYYLEFDDERSGGFEPLKAVSGDKKVVLGLITSKKPELEDKQAVIDRIHEAAKYISLDRLCLSPQCGFASCEIGNKLTEEEQWAKLALVKEIAEEVWG